MNYHVVSPLHERRIDITERNHSFFSQSGREGYGMSFGNTDIKSPVGELFHQVCHGTTGRHGRCDTYDPFILFSQFYQCMTEDILIELGLVQLVDDDTLTCFLVETARSVPFGSRFLRRLETFSLLRLDMKEFRPLHILDVVQQFDQITYRVRPPDRSSGC